MSVGLNHEALTRVALTPHVVKQELMSAETARQGASLDVVYEVQLRAKVDPAALVKEFNRIEGVQEVRVKRTSASEVKKTPNWIRPRQQCVGLDDTAFPALEK